MASKKQDPKLAEIQAMLEGDPTSVLVEQESQPTPTPKQKFHQPDFDLILEAWSQDKRLEVTDCLTLAQARYFMGIRPDGMIPPVLRKQVQRIVQRYNARHS